MGDFERLPGDPMEVLAATWNDEMEPELLLGVLFQA